MRYRVFCIVSIIGLLVWSSGVFAEDSQTQIIPVGEMAPRLVSQYESVSTPITFENQQQTVVGILTEPVMPSPYPVVMIFHGFTGQKDEMPVYETDETMFSRTARVLAEHGIASLRIDFRGSGDSAGEWPDTTFNGQISDALAAIDYVATLPQIDAEHLGLLGLSQGGLVAASAAARDERVNSVVLWSPVAIPYATYSTLLQPDSIHAGLNAEGDAPIPVSLPWGTDILLKRPFFEELLIVDPIAEIVHFAEPLLVIVGVQDAIVTPQPQMGQLYMQYHEGPEALVTLDADHMLSILAQSGELDKAIAWSVDWLGKTL